MRAGIICAILVVAARTAEATEIRKELAAAKSIAVLVHLVYPEKEPSGFVDTVRSRAIAEIQKRKRFEVVDDPSKADLVCLYVLYGPQWVERRRTKELVAESLGSSLIILKGGASQHWDAGPLWMYSDALERWTISLPHSLTAFHRQLARKKTRQQPPPPSQDVSRTEIVSDRPRVFVTCPEADFCNGAEAMQPNVTSDWSRVDDPARADYVVAWFGTRSEIPIGALALVRHLSAFIVFRGDRADWSVTPLFATIARTPVELNPLLESVMTYLRDSKRPAAVARTAPSAEDRSAKPRPKPEPWALEPISELLASNASPKLFEPKPGLAVIHFLRHAEPIARRIQNAPAAQPVGIAIDGVLAVNLEAGTYSDVTVDPGTHFITASGEHYSREPLRLTTEAGAVYYVLVEAGNVTGPVTLKQTDRFAADQTLSILSPAAVSHRP